MTCLVLRWFVVIMNKSIWEIPSAADDLLCERKVGNAHDTYAVAISIDKILSNIMVTTDKKIKQYNNSINLTP